MNGDMYLDLEPDDIGADVDTDNSSAAAGRLTRQETAPWGEKTAYVGPDLLE
jgi:hypothetical protein